MYSDLRLKTVDDLMLSKSYKMNLYQQNRYITPKPSETRKKDDKSANL